MFFSRKLRWTRVLPLLLLLYSLLFLSLPSHWRHLLVPIPGKFQGTVITAASTPKPKKAHEEPVWPDITETLQRIILVSCLGLATSTLSSCCVCFQSPVEFLPPNLEAPAQSRKKMQIGIGYGSRIIIWDCCLSGTWDFPAESLTVLTCTEPVADGEGKQICRCKCLYRPTWAEEFTVAALDIWSAQGLCFLDIWRTFPGIRAVFIMRPHRVSGEEQSELWLLVTWFCGAPEDHQDPVSRISGLFPSNWKPVRYTWHSLPSHNKLFCWAETIQSCKSTAPLHRARVTQYEGQFTVQRQMSWKKSKTSSVLPGPAFLLYAARS